MLERGFSPFFFLWLNDRSTNLLSFFVPMAYFSATALGSEAPFLYHIFLHKNEAKM